MKSNWLPIIIAIIIVMAIVNLGSNAYQQNKITVIDFEANYATRAVDTVWRGWINFRYRFTVIVES